MYERMYACMHACRCVYVSRHVPIHIRMRTYAECVRMQPHRSVSSAIESYMIILCSLREQSSSLSFNQAIVSCERASDPLLPEQRSLYDLIVNEVIHPLLLIIAESRGLGISGFRGDGEQTAHAPGNRSSLLFPAPHSEGHHLRHTIQKEPDSINAASRKLQNSTIDTLENCGAGGLPIQIVQSTCSLCRPEKSRCSIGESDSSGF
jgi:hypothetical protein